MAEERAPHYSGGGSLTLPGSIHRARIKAPDTSRAPALVPRALQKSRTHHIRAFLWDTSKSPQQGQGLYGGSQSPQEQILSCAARVRHWWRVRKAESERAEPGDNIWLAVTAGKITQLIPTPAMRREAGEKARNYISCGNT